MMAGCGGGDDADSKKAPPPPPNESSYGGGQPQGDPNAPPGGTGGGAENPNGAQGGEAKYLLKKSDGLYYEAKQVSDNPYSGKVKETFPTGTPRSEAVYQNGMLKSRTEWYEGGDQKKSVVTYDETGNVANKEEWREDGQKMTAVQKLPPPNPKAVGRTILWKKANLENIYQNKPTTTIIAAFGGPDDRMIEQTAASYIEIWVYNKIRVQGEDRKVALKTVKFTVDSNKQVNFVEVEF